MVGIFDIWRYGAKIGTMEINTDVDNTKDIIRILKDNNIDLE